MAYSNAYLTSGQGNNIASNFTFRVDVIPGGTTRRFESMVDEMRFCSVASGKLVVNIDGEPGFIIGPNGMFKIRSGVSCSVQNKLYDSATLHIGALTESD